MREIPDTGLPASLKQGKLGDILKHPELFEAYPQLKEINLKLLEGSSNRGEWDSETNTISLQSDASVSTLIHEIQHAVDTIEGFDDGSNIYQAGKLLDLMLDGQGDDFTPIGAMFSKRKRTEDTPRDFAYWKQTNAKRLAKLAEQIRELAGERLERAPSKNAGEIHALFQLTRMFETFATVIRKAELPASLMTSKPRPSQLIFGEGGLRTLGEILYRFNFGEITARTQQKLVETDESIDSEIGEAGVSLIEGINVTGRGEASTISMGRGRGKRKFDEAISRKIFGDSWGLPSKPMLKQLIDATAGDSNFTALRSALINVRVYGDTMAQSASESTVSRPRPDEGARIGHEAQAAGLNELVTP